MGAIIRFLVRQFEDALAHLGQSWVPLPALVGVRSPRGRNWDTSRIPDVTVLPLAQWEAMNDSLAETLREREAVINITEPPPILVVEVVSPCTKTDDYRSKRAEYGLLEIPEYWIVDPIEEKITLCVLEHQLYDSTEFRGTNLIQSSTFPDLNLTAAQVLASKL